MKNKKTFYDWCVDNNHEDWLQLWDYTLNTCTPKDISKAVNKKFYFKCPNGKHPSELKTICKLTRTDMDGRLFCKKCESFGQWCVDNNKIDLLKRWDCEKNKISPFFISKSSSSKKYYFKCPRGIHNSEGKRLNNIIRQQALSAGYNFIEIPYTAEKSDKYKEIIYNKIIELTGCKNSA